MSQKTIKINNLVKSFGNVKAVNGVSCEIQAGSVTGFIGANGAGKTTTMRMMVTLEEPDSGRINIFGHDTQEDPLAVRHLIGWMPDSFAAYPDVTVEEYMDFFARAFGLKGEARTKRLREVMAFTDLIVLADRPSGKLSKGQTQRLCLARALLHDPQLLVLDEPAAGLDPKARIEFKNLVKLLVSQGKTLFISSHILSELSEMCDSMLFIDEGVIVHHGSADSLLLHETQKTPVRVRVAHDLSSLKEWSELQPGVTFHEEIRDGAILHLEGQGSEALHQYLSRLIAAGLPIYEFTRIERRLEDAFVDMLNKTTSGNDLNRKK